MGFAWYRKPIAVTGASGPLTILMPPVDDVYELYWNGTKIGDNGKVPPHAQWNATPHAKTYRLPTNSGVLAVRVWKAPLASIDTTTLGGMEAAPRIGDSAYLALQARDTRIEEERRLLPAMVSSSLLLVTGLIAVLVFLRERSRWLYFWLGLYLFAIGVEGVRNVLRIDAGFLADQVYIQVFSCMADLSLWALLLALFGLDQEKRWRRWTLALAGLYFAAQVVDMAALSFWEYGGKGLVLTDAITTAIYTIAPLYIVAILIGGLRRRRQIRPMAARLYHLSHRSLGLPA